VQRNARERDFTNSRSSASTMADANTFMPRIGWMSFLNTLPMLHNAGYVCPPFSQNAKDVPSALNDAMRRGALDVSLVSTAAYLQERDRWTILSGLGISSSGPVNSVLWVYDTTFSLSKHRVMLPSSSESSSALLKHNLANESLRSRDYTSYAPKHWKQAMASDHNALLIGDIALKFYERHQRGDYPTLTVVDMASSWHAQTQLPFVFGLWCVHTDYYIQHREALDAWMLAMKRHTGYNLKHARELFDHVRHDVEHASTRFHKETLINYWLDNIDYGFGDSHMAAIDEMQRRLSANFSRT
jgi:predicted solute-binding protein